MRLGRKSGGIQKEKKAVLWQGAAALEHVSSFFPFLIHWCCSLTSFMSYYLLHSILACPHTKQITGGDGAVQVRAKYTTPWLHKATQFSLPSPRPAMRKVLCVRCQKVGGGHVSHTLESLIAGWSVAAASVCVEGRSPCSTDWGGMMWCACRMARETQKRGGGGGSKQRRWRGHGTDGPTDGRTERGREGLWDDENQQEKQRERNNSQALGEKEQQQDYVPTVYIAHCTVVVVVAPWRDHLWELVRGMHQAGVAHNYTGTVAYRKRLENENWCGQREHML